MCVALAWKMQPWNSDSNPINIIFKLMQLHFLPFCSFAHNYQLIWKCCVCLTGKVNHRSHKCCLESDIILSWWFMFLSWGHKRIWHESACLRWCLLLMWLLCFIKPLPGQALHFTGQKKYLKKWCWLLSICV